MFTKKFQTNPPLAFIESLNEFAWYAVKKNDPRMTYTIEKKIFRIDSFTWNR